MNSGARVDLRWGCALLRVLLCAILLTCQRAPSNGMLGKIDHLVYATPDLARGIAEIHQLIGVQPTMGGAHPGRGTHNALVSLGPTSYLEIIAPDPEQAAMAHGRYFGLDTLRVSKLLTWVAKGTKLESLKEKAAQNGIVFGEIRSGSRRRPDGVELSWRFTDPAATSGDGIVPFFIDWGRSPHPAETAAQGARLVSLSAEHPDPEPIRRMLAALGLEIPIQRGPISALVAVIEGPRGRIELR
jgi:hypothetical protein